MASAFVSYAHEDQELVLVLVKHLRAQGLEVRYDRVALRIGDSLIRAISQEIEEGDFLIAIVSPDSVESGWCQKELELAMTAGINSRQVKVLPVRFRGVEMPPMLGGHLGDADEDDLETLARRLAAAMQAHLEGRESDATREAEAAEPAVDGTPAHEEVVGDLGVAQLEEVAQRAFDVLQVWEGIWHGGNVRDLSDPQRRLRWALDALPDRVRAGLPLVGELALGDWDTYFAERDVEVTERDIREELLSVRTQVALGLPVTRRWTIRRDLGAGPPQRRDAASYLWELGRGEETRIIEVVISNTAIASENEYLPKEVAQAKETTGRSVVVSLLGLEDPPEEVVVSTAGVSGRGRAE